MGGFCNFIISSMWQKHFLKIVSQDDIYFWLVVTINSIFVNVQILTCWHRRSQINKYRKIAFTCNMHVHITKLQSGNVTCTDFPWISLNIVHLLTIMTGTYIENTSWIMNTLIFKSSRKIHNTPSIQISWVTQFNVSPGPHTFLLRREILHLIIS